ncbi:AAA family ATPase [Elioraea sp.]|uniref:AAA family ATPase n=1 Tax=Elioraea sp. TaxID=2185103 RepID=UPI0025B91B18|nr:AAA family ATPase [Elioraea sp.]
MRPERLHLSAFGAYAGEQVIDFSALGAHRIFLIHGPTGAGKTTLLDAICFALFGESSGDERGAADLRSHHAPATVSTFVDFAFALGPDHYRIRRTPAQTALGRGGREVKRAGDVTLWRRGEDAAERVLAEQAAPVRDALAELLGYTADEFRQVVLLPQGRFRELLVADRGARTQILATLFRTALYRRIEKQLREMEKMAEAEAASAEEHRRTLLTEAGAETIAAAEEAASALTDAAIKSARAAAEAARAAEAAEHNLAAGRDVARLLGDARAAAERLAACEQHGAAVEVDRVRLEAARRAQDVAADEAHHAAALAEATRARAAATEATHRVADAEKLCETAARALADEAARAKRANEAAAEATRLEALQGQAAGLATAARETHTTAAAHAVAMAQASRTEADAAATAATARAAADALASSGALAERAAERGTALVFARSLAEDARALAGARTAAEQQASAHERAMARYAAASARLDEAREARIAAERAALQAGAAALAAALAEGEACPVCGSRHHPSPAHHAGGTGADVTAARAAEDDAAVAAREAETQLLRADAARDAAARERDRLEARLAAHPGTPDAALPAAEAALAEAEAAEAALPTLTARAANAVTAAETAAAAALHARDALRMAGERLAAAEATHAALLGAVPEEARDAETLAARIADAAASAEALRTTLAHQRDAKAAADAALVATREGEQRAAAAVTDADARATDAERRLADAASRLGFAGIAAYRAAVLAPATIAALSAAIRTHDATLAAAREQAARAAEAAAGLATPDLAALATAAEQHRAAAQEAGREDGMARERAATATSRLVRIHAAEAGFAEARARHATVAKVSSLTRGTNRFRMSLEDFVLSSLLDQALAAANTHLARMLDGRFRLLRRAEPERANAAIGLDIEVFDEWTGQARPAGTLSGGEGFCAALALALGLSETVQAHAGARRIDALLIDEGFGSLDEEALDKAMDVLAGLPGGDRLVGLISHVGELKARIPARLEVTPGLRGSTARFVIG